jgi:diacylglycerol kinase (ATP)
MDRPVKHLFVINPHSFWNGWKLKKVINEIRSYFAAEESQKTERSAVRAESKNFRIEISQFPRDAIGIIQYYAKEVLPENTLRVYAVGGDGILFDCLNGIAGLEHTELGAVPYGRSNDFIRGFGRRNEALFRNIGLQVTAPAVPMDVIRSGGEESSYALNFCATGVTSLAFLHIQKLRETLERSSRLFRWLTHKFYRYIYWLGSFPAFLKRNILQQSCKVIVDGEQFEGRFRGILIANGPYYCGGRSPAPGAMPNDGLLDVVLARGATLLRFLRQLPFYMRGLQVKFPDDFILRRAKKIAVHSAEPMLIALDDQIFFNTDLTVELLPAAVRFLDVTAQGYQGVISNG